MNKKAIELSMNFFVLLIISIAVFGYSLKFLYSAFESVSVLEQKSFDQLDKEVESLTCSTQQVCLGTSWQQIARGSFKVFGLRILNSRTERADFDIDIEQKQGMGFPATELYFKPAHREVIALEPGEIKNLGIGVEIPKTAESGDYVLNIKVTSDGEQYGDSVYKIKINVP